MPAHLIDLTEPRGDRPKCQRCSKRASVRLRNTWNASNGMFCKPHGEAALKEQLAREDETWKRENALSRSMVLAEVVRSLKATHPDRWEALFAFLERNTLPEMFVAKEGSIPIGVARERIEVGQIVTSEDVVRSMFTMGTFTIAEQRRREFLEGFNVLGVTIVEDPNVPDGRALVVPAGAQLTADEVRRARDEALRLANPDRIVNAGPAPRVALITVCSRCRAPSPVGYPCPRCGAYSRANQPPET